MDDTFRITIQVKEYAPAGETPGGETATVYIGASDNMTAAAVAAGIAAALESAEWAAIVQVARRGGHGAAAARVAGGGADTLDDAACLEG